MKTQNATKIAEKDINSSEYSISFSPALLMAGNEALLKKIEEQQREIETLKQREYAVKVADPNPYSDYKSDGVRKAHAADSIRSYDDFKAIQDYFLKKNDVRDWALWTIGVSLGLRISDLFLLRFNNIVCEDKITIRDRIKVFEKKTGKLQNCLVTESVRVAMNAYLDDLKYNYDYEGYLFPSKKTGGKMYEEHGWRIISNAGKELGLPLNIGSHTMRKSFANIAACADRSTIDMNSITKIQGLLNHSDQRTTLKYLGTYQKMFDQSRRCVSDFVLGKSNINYLVAGGTSYVDNLLERIDRLEKRVSG